MITNSYIFAELFLCNRLRHFQSINIGKTSFFCDKSLKLQSSCTYLVWCFLWVMWKVSTQLTRAKGRRVSFKLDHRVSRSQLIIGTWSTRAKILSKIFFRFWVLNKSFHTIDKSEGEEESVKLDHRVSRSQLTNWELINTSKILPKIFFRFWVLNKSFQAREKSEGEEGKL